MNKLLEILGSSKLQLTETDDSREYDITEIEKYSEISRITIRIERTYQYFYSYYCHGVIIIPLKEPIEINREVSSLRVGTVDNLFILVLNNLIDTWLSKEKREFIPRFIRVLESNRIGYTISDSGIFVFNNGFTFSSLTRTFNNDSNTRVPTTVKPREVLNQLLKLVRTSNIYKWKSDSRKGIKKYTI